MSERSSARKILLWLFSKVMRPWQIIRGTWRERQRVKRSSLVRLFEEPSSWPSEVKPQDFDEVSRRYHEFEGYEALREHPAGTFQEFESFVGDAQSTEPETKRQIKLIRAWRRAYALSEVKNVFVITTLGLAMLVLAASAIGAGLLALQLFSGFGVSDYLTQIGFTRVAEMTTPTLANSVALIVPLIGLAGLTRFLRDYLGDVESWTTYEETDEKHRQRREVIKRGTDLLAHVLQTDEIERVVVVGHSLGTAIAQDCLLDLRRSNEATNPSDPISGPIPLAKISHFVTLGSPIDKIHYFFESYRSRHHRYKRVVEDLRGDIGDAPFSKNTKPHVHWINYWDEADVISGPLHSPADTERFRQRVDNVHTTNLHFPDPGAAHSAYFDNGEVIRGVLEVVFLGSHRFANAPERETGGRDYEAVFIGPGTKRKGTRFLQYGMLATPYLALAASLAYFLGGPRWSYMVPLSVLSVIVFVCILGALISKQRGARASFEIRR